MKIPKLLFAGGLILLIILMNTAAFPTIQTVKAAHSETLDPAFSHDEPIFQLIPTNTPASHIISNENPVIQGSKDPDFSYQETVFQPVPSFAPPYDTVSFESSTNGASNPDYIQNEPVVINPTYNKPPVNGSVQREPVSSGTVIFDNMFPKGQGEAIITNYLKEKDAVGILYQAMDPGTCIETSCIYNFDLNKPLIAVYVGANQTEKIIGIPIGMYEIFPILAEDWNPITNQPSENAELNWYDELQRENPDQFPNIFQVIELIVPAYIQGGQGGGDGGSESGSTAAYSSSSSPESKETITTIAPDWEQKATEVSTIIPTQTTGTVVLEGEQKTTKNPSSLTAAPAPNPLNSPLGIIIGAITWVENLASENPILLIAAVVIVIVGVIAWRKGYLGRE